MDREKLIRLAHKVEDFIGDQPEFSILMNELHQDRYNEDLDWDDPQNYGTVNRIQRDVIKMLIVEL